MKDITARIIGIALFIIFGLVKDNIGTTAYWILVLLLVVAAFVSSEIRYRKFAKEHGKCPICGAKTEKAKRKQNIYPEEEKVYIGKTRFISGVVMQGYTVISCTECDWEIPYKQNREKTR